MKKFFSLICFFRLLLFCLYAETYTNVYQYVYENKYYAELLDATNRNISYEDIKKIYETGSANIQDTVTLIRLKCDYMEYVNNLKISSTKKELKTILESCYTDLEKLNNASLSSVVKDSLTFLVYGMDYRVTGSISKGTNSIKLIDNCYENNKNDAGIMILYAQRKAEAPSIGGGDTKVAISVLCQLLENIDNCTTGLKYRIYRELGFVYEKTDKTKSKYYYDLAEKLY